MGAVGDLGGARRDSVSTGGVHSAGSHGHGNLAGGLGRLVSLLRLSDGADGRVQGDGLGNNLAGRAVLDGARASSHGVNRSGIHNAGGQDLRRSRTSSGGGVNNAAGLGRSLDNGGALSRGLDGRGLGLGSGVNSSRRLSRGLNDRAGSSVNNGRALSRRLNRRRRGVNDRARLGGSHDRRRLSGRDSGVNDSGGALSRSLDGRSSRVNDSARLSGGDDRRSLASGGINDSGALSGSHNGRGGSVNDSAGGLSGGRLGGRGHSGSVNDGGRALGGSHNRRSSRIDYRAGGLGGRSALDGSAGRGHNRAAGASGGAASRSAGRRGAGGSGAGRAASRGRRGGDLGAGGRRDRLAASRGAGDLGSGNLGSGRERLLRTTATIAKSLQSVLGIGVTLDDIRLAPAELPQAETTPVLVALVLADEIAHLVQSKETIAGIRASRESDEDLGVLALVTLVEDRSPILEVELSVGRLAVWVVVRLKVNSVQLSLLDEALEREKRMPGRALRSGRDVDVLLVLAELLYHGDIGIVANVVSLTVLEIKIKTVNLGVEIVAVEGARAIPVGVVRTESVPEEIGKAAAVGDSRDLVVAVTSVINATNGQNDLDTHITTLLDAFGDGATLAPELGFMAILAVVSIPTVAGKVGSGITSGLVPLGSSVDEADGNLRNTLGTVLGDVVGLPLTLLTMISDVASQSAGSKKTYPVSVNDTSRATGGSGGGEGHCV